METNKVFKFAILRNSTLPYDPPKSDSSAVINALRSTSTQTELTELANEYTLSTNFIRPDNLNFKILVRMSKTIGDRIQLSNSDIDNVVDSLDQFIDDAESSGTNEALLDSLVVSQILDSNDQHTKDLADAYRTLKIISKLSKDKSVKVNTTGFFELPYLGHKHIERTSQPSEDNKAKTEDKTWNELIALSSHNDNPKNEKRQKNEKQRPNPDLDNEEIGSLKLQELSIDAKLLLHDHGMTLDRLNKENLERLILWKAADQKTKTSAEKKSVIHKGGITAVVNDDSKTVPPKDDIKLNPDGGFAISLLPNAVKLSVGELFLVRKTLAKYQFGEISHIENVLAGEHRSRTHRYLHRVEDIQLTSESKTHEKEEHLESTDRFEVEQQSSSLTRAELGLEANGKISYSYGPSFSVEGSTKASTDITGEKTKKKSLTYAKEVMSKTIDKTVEQIRKERQLKITDEIEETNLHEFASNPNEDTVGIYRWIDKIYDMELVNYGKRMMLDITIPEPAVHYLRTLGLGYPETTLVEPEPFIIEPLDINEFSLNDWVKRYNAEGIEAAPNDYTRVSHTEHATREQVTQPVHKTANVTMSIPEDYQAIKAHITVEWLHTTTNDVAPQEGSIPLDFRPMVRIGVGQKWTTIRKNTFNDNPMDDEHLWEKTIQLSSETRELPLAMVMYFTGIGTVTVELTCKLTNHAYRNWQLRTFDLLHTAYQSRMVEYEEQKTLIELKSRNLQNERLKTATFEQIERDELKRGVIEFLSGQPLGSIDPLHIQAESNEFPSIHKANTDRLSEIILFFEQVFEWGNIQYDLYPYFWGHESRWVEKLAANVDNEAHKAFLQAGSAHVLVPIKPGSELEALHYINYGRVWRGSGPVMFQQGISSIYMDLLNEFQNYDMLDEKQQPVGEPWQETVPTSLIMIQDSDELPDLNP